ncbi:MAG: MFS transporter, partial [Planctomycetota bacterium]
MTRAAFVAELRRKPPAALARLGTVVLSHPILDAYAGFVPPLLGVLQVRCELTPFQAASLLSLGPLTSGLCQPFFAWMTDRVDSRILGSLGLVFAAAALSCIGLADSFGTLVILFTVGMLGVGAFHPVAAASVGQMAGRRRSMGVTMFFVAGMVGAALGPIISTRVTAIEPDGFALLRWAMIPGLITAVFL